ncbi:protein TILLER ANGLE CONTROL 1 isoform X2 [Humulus lupulus]|uniref:protein TILLER ANGLE CONTROL 1 isoform X2 n=1 Tax=Humulus lupulus TaxID=3486 RepID=UPI002B4107B2|nr:protein TILLER ANGLE CONTROL 1 isoform X2 [Humulus lupulus]
MKLFNWVHKRFHHDPLPKDHEFAQKVEKKRDELLHSNDKDTQALLKKVVLIDALDGWKDGILAIGTFGFDPLKPFNQQYSQKEYLVLESEQEDDDDEAESQEFSLDDEDSDDDDEEDSDDTCADRDEEVNPLMFSSALGHSFKEVITSDQKNDQHVLLSLDGVSLASKDQELAAQVNQSVLSEEKKKAGRTTLADLFLADGDVKMKIDSGKVLAEESINKKTNVRTKKSLSFAKKLIPRVKEEASPIKNLQRLMRRMLKRKIHPEALDAKMNKSEGQKATGGIELVTNTPKKASESVSLLAMQGITI